MRLNELTTSQDAATVKVAIDTHFGFALLTFSGPITIETLGLAFRTFMRHRDYAERMPVVLDYTEASFSNMDPVALKQMTSYMSTRDDRHHTKIAFVLAGNLQRSLTRIYDAFAASEVPQTRQLFTNVYAAIGWLIPAAA